MDFIERYFGFSPDHGDGTLEGILLLALVTLITGLSLRLFHKAKYEVPRKKSRN
jgi:hypothetical protein